LKAKYAAGLLEVMRDSAAPHVRKVADLRFSIHDGDREGFKAEWMVVKDGKLVIGGHGRERTKPSDGRAVVSRKPMWVASVDSNKWGGVHATNWTLQYEALRQAAGTPFPGYLLHEAVLWSALRREWIFLPRRVSAEAYDGQDAERKGSRCLFVAREDFSTIRRLEVAGLPEAGGLRGFSASAFVPGTKEQWIVALRTVEVEGLGSEKRTPNRTTGTFLSVFDLEDLDATTLVYPETEISKMKFEGIAFV
jgi:soluble calcium-activated nucleotidase 1